MWSWLSVALSGFISVNANERSQYDQAAVFKTLSLGMLVIILWTQGRPDDVSVWWVTLGIVVSMFADVLYIYKKKKKLCFSAFILAQLCYSAAYWLMLSGGIVWWLPAMLLAISVVVFFLMLPKIDRVIFPVVIMGMVLFQFNWAAGELWLTAETVASMMGFVGTLTLTCSAALLAVHDYKHSITYGRYLISGSYLLAHSLIVASLIT
ncbi:lysoplasmalogenase family protein [Vibrio sp. Of14-4]|uniref:lysoplasmalogenase n=1 Tax=Vibrio sp. Of14-4 TaxID=2724878 RepID=UPI001EF26ECF|nr:lysoplasmalogenase family protein [Vibrio sp. Of14-4]MCG7491459.1 lysoplasmalogenase family protein [Vibrio sp. Of14-4]